jgi:hypothetical protein
MNPGLLLVLLAALFAASIKTAPAQTPSSSIQQIAAIRHEWVNDWKSKIWKASARCMRKAHYFYQPMERGLKVEMPSETNLGNSSIRAATP